MSASSSSGPDALAPGNGEPATDDHAPGEVPAQNSLVVRTGIVLASALVIALIALFLFFRPYLEESFRDGGADLLRQEQARLRGSTTERQDDAAALLEAARAQVWRAAQGEIADAPLELVDGDPAALRALLEERLAAAAADDDRNLAALVAELERRDEAHLRAADLDAAAENAARAASFGQELAFRVGALLLVLLVLVFLILGVLLFRGVIAPVQRLNAATRDVARGDLRTRIPVDGDDELGQLARSFNGMTRSLERALGDLRELNATLEDKVREKTAAVSRALEESREANRRLESALEELRTKESELRRADKMASLGTLAGGVAHEFNNLLGGILGCAEDAAAEEDQDELRETLGVIQRTARRGAAITAKLLRFARPTEGVRTSFDAALVLHDVAALVEPEAHRGGAQVNVETSGDTQLVAEESGLHQVLLNLATNALHAMADVEGGTLTLRVEDAGEHVRLTVRDTGVGITPEARERLFEPFFTTRGVNGTGLGLAVSYGIVTAHGGQLEVESAPGRGALFSVTLPRTPPAENGAQALASPPQENPS